MSSKLIDSISLEWCLGWNMQHECGMVVKELVASEKWT